MLRLEGVSASYRGLKALQGVDLEVGQGEVVAVVGANGAGKSTLLKAIAGQAGRLEVFERLPHRPFPGGRLLRTPLLVATMAFVKLRNLIW